MMEEKVPVVWTPALFCRCYGSHVLAYFGRGPMSQSRREIAFATKEGTAHGFNA